MMGLSLVPGYESQYLEVDNCRVLISITRVPDFRVLQYPSTRRLLPVLINASRYHSIQVDTFK